MRMYDYRTVPVKANRVERIAGPFQSFGVIDCTADAFAISESEGGPFRRLPRGVFLRDLADLEALYVQDLSGADNTLTITGGTATVDDRRNSTTTATTVADGGDATLGAKADAAAAADTSAASLIALFKRSLVKSTRILLGQSASMTDTADHDIADPGGTKVAKVEQLLVLNSSAVETLVVIKEESTGDLFTIFAPAKSCLTHPVEFTTAVAGKKLRAANATNASAVMIAAFGRKE